MCNAENSQNADLATLNPWMATAKGQITALQGYVTTLQGQVSQLLSNMAAAQTTIITNKSVQTVQDSMADAKISGILSTMKPDKNVP